MKEGVPRTTSVDPAVALQQGARFYAGLQTNDGHWAGDYGGPMFLMPGLVITAAVTGVDLGVHHRSAMTTYLLNHQQTDGGWGLHIESPSTMFGTVLNYVTLRLLVRPPPPPRLVRALVCVCASGGPSESLETG